MPTNKNAMIRYQILDELFQNRANPIPVNKLLDTVNFRLREMGMEEIVTRTLQKDIKFMREKDPWFAPIITVEVLDDDPVNGTKRMSKAYCYEDRGYSIFNRDLSYDEKQLLKAALRMLGQFNGLPQMIGLDRLVSTANDVESNQIVQVQHNPEDDTSLLGELYLAIAEKRVLNLHYHTSKEPDTDRVIVLHPYLLKQYNNRWYLIGADNKDGKILNFRLGQINKIDVNYHIDYIPAKSDLTERFDEIIGVTLDENQPLENILFWVSDRSKYYIISKPIHDYQTQIKQAEEAQLRAKYPMLEGGAFFRLEVRYNYELIKELSSYGPELIVLSPKSIQKKVHDRVSAMDRIYNQMETDMNQEFE